MKSWNRWAPVMVLWFVNGSVDEDASMQSLGPAIVTFPEPVIVVGVFRERQPPVESRAMTPVLLIVPWTFRTSPPETFSNPALVGMCALPSSNAFWLSITPVPAVVKVRQRGCEQREGVQ